MAAAKQVELPDYGGLFWKPFRHLALHGGRGAAKSRTVATALVIQAAQQHERILCGREVQKSIKDSVKRLLDDEIGRLGLSSVFTSTETEIRGPNDSLFIFSGIKGNANGVKSTEGITTFWGEEAQAFSQASIDTIIPTIRQPNSRLIWTWNPDLETDPIDVLFRGHHGPPPKSIVREVNYDENPWFPDVLREAMEFDQARDIDKFNHIWRGQYRRNSEARVFKNWRVEAFDTPTNVDFRLGADFGFSIDPSTAIRCYIAGREIYIDYEAWGLGIEIDKLPFLFMQIPDGERWPMVADSSRPETISYLRRNGFPLIISATKGARSVEEGVEFLKSYDLVIHPRCQHLIDEMTLYSWKVDSLTGLVLPQLADKENHCIAEGQRVLCERGLVPIEDVTLADQVWTRAGWKRVLFADQTDADRSIVEIEAGGRTLRCTPDHELWICGKGMVRADALRYGDEILMEVSAPWQNQKSSFGMATNTGDIQTARARVTAVISAGLERALRRCFIGMCGNLATVRSLRAIIFITSMAIRGIMIFPTWNASKPTNTFASTAQNGLRNGASSRPNTLTASAIRQKLGTVPMKAGQSIARLAQWLTRTLRAPPSLAGIAALPSPPGNWEASICIARISASLQRAAPVASTTSTAPAANAPRDLLPIVTASPLLVPVRVQAVREAGQCARVFDLTVEDQHEFIAEGMLVSNCIDALRYAVEGVRRAARMSKPTTFVPLPMVSNW